MNEEIQHKTIDKGWTSMKTILDKEMPATSQRRRFLWWWLALLFIPLAAVGSWVFLMDPPTPKAPLHQPTQSSGIPFAATQPNDAPINTGKASREVAPEAENQQNTVAKNTQSPTVAGAQPGLLKNQTIGQAVRVTPVLNETTVPNPSVTAMPSQEPVLMRASSVSSTNLMEINQAKTALAGIAFLSVTPGFVQAQSNRADLAPSLLVSAESQNGIIRPKKSPIWSIGGNVALGTEKFTKTNSVGAGLTVLWQPTRHWGARSGLNFKQYNPSATAQPAATVRSGQYEKAVISSYDVTDLDGNLVASATTVFSQQQPIIIPVTNLKLVEIPVLASWRINGLATLFAGLNSSFILATTTRNESFLGVLTLKANTDTATKNLNDLATNDLQRCMFDFQSGFGLHVGKNWELGVFANFPLQKWSALFQTTNNGYGNLGLDTSIAQNRRPITINVQASYFFNSLK